MLSMRATRGKRIFFMLCVLLVLVVAPESGAVNELILLVASFIVFIERHFKIAVIISAKRSGKTQFGLEFHHLHRGRLVLFFHFFKLQLLYIQLTINPLPTNQHTAINLQIYKRFFVIQKSLHRRYDAKPFVLFVQFVLVICGILRILLLYDSILRHSRPPKAKNITTCSILSTPIIVNESQMDINVFDSFCAIILDWLSTRFLYPDFINKNT